MKPYAQSASPTRSLFELSTIFFNKLQRVFLNASTQLIVLYIGPRATMLFPNIIVIEKIFILKSYNKLFLHQTT